MVKISLMLFIFNSFFVVFMASAMRIVQLNSIRRVSIIRSVSRGGSTAKVTEERLSNLRSWMSQKKCAAVVIPSEDPHLSEYVAELFQRREALSGFTGSAGVAVVTTTDARLWTDGRYFLQAN